MNSVGPLALGLNMARDVNTTWEFGQDGDMELVEDITWVTRGEKVQASQLLLL